MGYIDLTEPVNNSHWKYPNYVRTLEFKKRESLIKSTFMSLDRGFTHILAPSSMIENGKTLDDFDVFHTLIGKAAVLHIENVKAGQEITKQQLEDAYLGCESSKILLVVTGFGRTHDSYSHEYWTMSPHLSAEAAAYLADLKPDVVAFDFPEDIGMGIDDESRYDAAHNPVHKILLEKNILVIDYMNFAWKIPVKSVDFYALPLRNKVGSYDYGAVRVVVKS